MTSSEYISKNAIMRSNIALLTKKQAIELIELCKVENKIILGIDSFIVFERAIQPISEDSVDFAYAKNNESNNCCAAQKFIESRHNDKYYYEVVFK